MPGGQSPATPGLTLEAIERLLDAKIAPIAAKVERSTNFDEGRKRIARKGSADTPDPATVTTNSPNIDSIPDEATRNWARQVQREREAERAAQAEAADRAERDKAMNRLDALIAEAKPARPDLMRKLLVHDIKVGTDGKVYHDDGATLRPLDDVVREYAANDVFKPASGSQGTGTTPGVAPVIGKPNLMAHTASIKDPVARLQAQHALASRTGA